MARARNIKPGFFKNEHLVELPFETRLLFAGLWTLADREGRLEDRPKKIKMEIFPADNVDVNEGLQQLHEVGMIVRYVVENKGYIEVCTFTQHQNPHVKEAASVIPTPDKHCTNTVLATPLTSSLNPDSLSSDSLLVCEADPNEAENAFTAEVIDGIKERQKLNFIRDEAGWSDTAIFARTNNFTAATVLECYDLLRKQKWRKGPVSPKNVSDNITNMDNLRIEIKEQDNAGNKKTNTRNRSNSEDHGSTQDFLDSIGARPLPVM